MWWDDFLGDSIDDIWATALTGAGTAAVVDAQDGGIVRLNTPTASDAAYIYWGNIRSLHVNKRVTIEARIRANNGVTDTLRAFLALRYDDNNRIMFYHNTDSADIYIRCTDDGGVTSRDSNINLDANYHIFRIECHIHGATHVHFYIDGVETANSPITTNVPDDAGDYLQTYLYIITNADTDPATSMDIDYIGVRQDV